MQQIEMQNIFQILNMGYNHGPQKFTKIVITAPMFIISEDEFTNYPKNIKDLYKRIFATSYDTDEVKKAEIKLDLNFPIKETPMPICNKILTIEQAVFRCYDCMTHQASVLCKKCFENANHKGHRYSQISSGGGNCDCGNPDAIKPVGFCSHHPGKAQPVHINQKQKQNFLEVMLNLFEWIFRLHERTKSKSSDILGQIVAESLRKLNEQSLYYNTLTYNLFMSTRKYGQTQKQREEKILDTIFSYGVKLINFSKKMTDVFFNMFSLEIFKYELTAAYTIAYNRINNFQTSKFKSLYIQLYANNDILERLLVQNQLVLYPESIYAYGEYIDNLMFLCTIKPEVASKFFMLLNQKGIVRIPEMDEIEEVVQTDQEHIVSIINENLNNESFYYTLMQNIIMLFQNCRPSLILMFQNYTNAVMDTKYSYKKNKVVMPFHKILGMILLSIYEGKVQQVSAQKIQKFIQEKYQVKDVFLRVFKLILECFKQFSKTFFQTSYFDNYNALYVRSGEMIINFDMLMFSICLGIFNQLGLQKEMNEILFSIFNFDQKNEEKEKLIKPIQKNSVQRIENENDDDFESISSEENIVSENILANLQNNTHLLKVIIESCVSNRSQILISNNIKVQNSIIKQKNENLFIEVMNNFKQITVDNLKQISKNFIGTKRMQDIIKKYLSFDKVKKKYTLNEIKNEKMSEKKFPIFLCPSLKKIGGIFGLESKQNLESLILGLQISKQKIQKLKLVANEKFLEKITNQFVNKLISLKSQGNKQIEKVFLDFAKVMRTLQYLFKQQTSSIITNFFELLVSLSEKQEFNFLNEEAHKKITLEIKEQKKQNTKLKFQEAKRKKLEKIKQMQSKYDDLLEKEKIQQEKNEHLCMICKEDKPGLCFLANFSYSNVLQSLKKVEGRNLIFKSCFHPIHISCFISRSKTTKNSIACPLCKTESNIMLPSQKEISNINTLNEIYERIITLRVSFREVYYGYDTQFQQYGVLTILRSLTSIIGKNLLQGQSILNHKDQRLANILYSMIQNVTLSYFTKKKNDEEVNKVKEFLEKLQKKIENSSFQQNFYAFEYVTLKIFYSCFIQKADDCLKILQKHALAYLNKNDIKKIWDMCNQIVTLPVLPEYEIKLQPKQMSSNVVFYSPPENVISLIKLRDECSNLCKNGHQICICLICQQKTCLDCRQVLRHSTKVHCGQYIGFNLLTGGLEYYLDSKTVHFPSLYGNDMGFLWKPSQKPEGYVFEKENFNELKKEIVNDDILKFLTGKYPETFKKILFFDMNIF